MPRRKQLSYPRKSTEKRRKAQYLESRRGVLRDHNYHREDGDDGHIDSDSVTECVDISNQSDGSKVDLQTCGEETGSEVCEDQDAVQVCDVETICANVEVSTSLTKFQTLQRAIVEHIHPPFHLIPMEDMIQIVEYYKTHNPSVKLCVNIENDLTAKLFVHRSKVSDDHEIWDGLSETYTSASDVMKLLHKLQRFTVCIANPDPEFQEIVPIGKGLSSNESSTIAAYREGDLGAMKGDIQYSSTIRSVRCSMLVQGARCKDCSRYRRTLRERKQRLDERLKMDSRNFMSSKVNHKFYSKSDLMEKISQQKQKIKEVEQENWKIKRQFNRDVYGITLDESLSDEMKDTMITCEDEIKKEFPDSNSVQRLF